MNKIVNDKKISGTCPNNDDDTVNKVLTENDDNIIRSSK